MIIIHLSISNIAWSSNENEDVYDLMCQYGFDGLEIAPTAIRDDIFNVPTSTLTAFREKVNSYGIEIVAMQSLLYGHPEMTIFGDSSSRVLAKSHLQRCIDMGAILGVKAYIFGSPKNRCVPASLWGEHIRIATDFFDDIGRYAYERGGVFCIEPNPESYGTNFLNTTAEALNFVKHIDNPGLKINIDTGTIIENHENFSHVLHNAKFFIGHVHVSEPFLAPIDNSRIEHDDLARFLKDEGYSHTVSIEMKKVSEKSCLEPIRDALEYVSTLYR